MVQMRRDGLTGDSQLAVGVNVNMWMVVCLCVLDRQPAQAVSDNRNQLNHQLLYGLRWADCGWASLTELMLSLMMYISILQLVCVCLELQFHKYVTWRCYKKSAVQGCHIKSQ